MKKLLFISLAILMGCVIQKNTPHEDMLYVTRKYVGDFVGMEVEKRATHIVTTREDFYITGRPVLDIPYGARCYIKYFPEKIVGSVERYWILYFTWGSTEDLYMLRQNWVTGRIY